MKYLKWSLAIGCFVFQIVVGQAQQAGLLLIHQKNPNRKVVIPAGKYLVIKYNNQQQAGFLNAKTNDFVKLMPKNDGETPIFDLTKDSPLIVYEIPINRIESIAYKNSLGKKTGKIIGASFTLCGTLLLATGLATQKTRPDLGKPWTGMGLLGLGIGIPVLLSTRHKKYDVGGDAWSVN